MKIFTEKQFENYVRELKKEFYNKGFKKGFQDGLHEGMTSDKNGTTYINSNGIYFFNKIKIEE